MIDDAKISIICPKESLFKGELLEYGDIF